jgi:hypothetical protein
VDLSSCAVVIPSNREVLAPRLAAIPPEVPIYVVEDSDAPVHVSRPGVRVFSKDFQRRFMGRDYGLIPRGTAACRNFGFYYIWCETSCRYIISLDDDVATRDGFMDGYAALGERHTIDTAGGSEWLNTIDLFDDAPPCYARGFPFDARGPATTEWSLTTARVVAHMGLWDGVLDTHAVDKQLFPDYRVGYTPLSLPRRLVRIAATPRVSRFPFSSMNFGFARDVLPAMYQIPMRPQFIDRYALWRYDDIWAGYIAQTLAAKRDDACTIGAPIVAHEKAGDLQRELMGEHCGILMSPHVYAVVDRAAEDVRPSTYLEMYADLMDRILTSQNDWRRRAAVPPAYAAFIADFAETSLRWAKLCSRSCVQSMQ